VFIASVVGVPAVIEISCDLETVLVAFDESLNVTEKVSVYAFSPVVPATTRFGNLATPSVVDEVSPEMIRPVVPVIVTEMLAFLYSPEVRIPFVESFRVATGERPVRPALVVVAEKTTSIEAGSPARIV
jgi:hypothetical protein